jgi:hypothetical protein
MHSTPRRKLAFIAVLATVLLALSAMTRAASPTEQCAAKKMKAAGQEVFATMVCFEKAKRAGTTVDSICLGNARTKGDAGINKAGTSCPGTTTEIDAAVDSCVAAFLNDDPASGACPAATAMAIGKSAKAELACQSRDVTRPGTFTTCDAAEDGRTIARLGSAGGGTACVNVTSVMTDIDNCDTTIDAVLNTTTTTTLPPCGGPYPTCGGTCPPGQSCYPVAGASQGICVCATTDVPCFTNGQFCSGGFACPSGEVCHFGFAPPTSSCECGSP